MNNRFKKALSSMLAATLILSVSPVNGAVIKNPSSAADRSDNFSPIKSVIDFFEKAVGDLTAKSYAAAVSDIRWTFENDTLTISGSGATTDYTAASKLWSSYNSSCKKIVVKSGVTSIGNYYFKGLTNVTSVTLPATLKRIGNYAFSGFAALKSISVPDSVTYIGECAFSGCERLQRISLPFTGGGPDNATKGKTDYFGYIFNKTAQNGFYQVLQGNYLDTSRNTAKYYIPATLTTVTFSDSAVLGVGGLSDCTGIKTLSVNSEVIPSCFANHCTSLENLSLGSNVKKLDSYSFSNIDALKKVVLPDGIVTIGQTFTDCPNLTEINFPDSVKSVVGGAFNNTPFYDSLTDEFSIVGNGLLIKYNGNDTDIALPEGVKRVCGAFSAVEADNITFSSSVIAVGSFAIGKNIKKLTLNEGLSEIGDYAFNYASSLEECAIPSTVRTIGRYAFEFTKITSITLPEGLEEIGDYAFYNARSLTECVIPSSIKRIGCYAFGNASLATLTIPYGVEEIGDYAFCEGFNETLRTVELPDSIKKVGKTAFTFSGVTPKLYLPFIGESLNCTDETKQQIKYSFSFSGVINTLEVRHGEVTAAKLTGCNSIIYLSLPDTMTAIPDNAFKVCKINFITSAPALKTIGNNAFSKNFTLQSIPTENIEEIGSNAFEQCCLLESISFPKLKNLGENAFKACTKLKSVSFGDSLSIIPEGTFEGCDLLSSVTFPASLKTIKDNAFPVSQIESLTFPEGLETIGGGNFNNTDKLKEIHFPSTLISLDANSFKNCSELEEITIPASSSTYMFKDGWLYKKSGEFALSVSVVNGIMNIPATVTGIPIETFDIIKGATGFTVENGNKDYSVSDEILYNADKSQIIKCSNEKTGNVVIPATVKTVRNGAFLNCADITGIEIMSESTSVGKGAFLGCDALKSLSIPSITTENQLADYFSASDTVSSNLSELTIKNQHDCEELWKNQFLKFNLTKIEIKGDITYVGKGGFDLCHKLETLILPDTVTRFEAYAFRETALKSFTVPKSITVIPAYAFSNCRSLSEITLHDNITEIDEYAFYGCDTLTEITIPKNIQAIGYRAFSGCFSLSKVNYNNPDKTLSYMGNNVFESCDAFSDLPLPDGCTEIPGIFANCNGLRYVTVPSTVKKIQPNAFYNSEIINITLPESLELIGDYAFANSTSLKSVIFSGSDYSKLTIGKGAFYYCRNLDEAPIPDGLHTIPIDCFEESGIKKAVIPSSVTTIETRAFNYCQSLTELVFPENCSPDLTIGDYAFSHTVSLSSLTLPNGLKEVPKYCFVLSAINELILPDSLEVISEQAFNCCNNIKSVTLPENIKKIGPHAFDDCSTLSEVIYKPTDKSLSYMEYNVFSNCGFTSLQLPDGCTNIPNGMFSGNPLTEIVIPDTVVTVGMSSFYQTAAKTVTIGKNTVNVGTHAFADSDNLTEIIYRNNDTTLSGWDEYVFYNCDALEEIFLPENCERFSDSMFSHCKGIVELIIPTSVKSIGTLAFSGCSSVKSVYIPKNVTYIGRSAFAGCSSLEKIIIESTSDILKGTFSNCSSLQIIVIPDSVTAIDTEAFKDTNNVVIYCNNKSYASEFATENNIKYTTLVVDSIKNEVYTGAEICPSPNVSINQTALNVTTDYALSYKDNINVGTAKVFVRGVGDYRALTATCEFKITPLAISSATVTAEKEGIYSPGGTKLPPVTVRHGEKTLTEGTDYEILCPESIGGAVFGVKTFNYSVSFIGNYSGIKNMTFKVTPKDIADSDIVFISKTAVFDGTAPLVAGIDYTYTVSNTENDETIITLTGLGNYTGITERTESTSFDASQIVFRLIAMLAKIIMALSLPL